MKKSLSIIALGVLALLIGWPVLALPATLSLPAGQRPGVDALTIEQAAGELRATGLQGAELAEAARALTGERMAYCRRNSFDGAERAFSRGYGYCQQSAFALRDLLRELDFEAEVVQSTATYFYEDDLSTPHAWVRATVEGQPVDLDPLFWDEEEGRPAFEPRAEVTGMPFWFRALAGWGSTTVNAFRYYRTGSDLG